MEVDDQITHTYITDSQQTEPKFYQNYLRNEAYSRRNQSSLSNQDLPRRSTFTSRRQTSSTKTPTLLTEILRQFGHKYNLIGLRAAGVFFEKKSLSTGEI